MILQRQQFAWFKQPGRHLQFCFPRSASVKQLGNFTRKPFFETLKNNPKNSVPQIIALNNVQPNISFPEQHLCKEDSFSINSSRKLFSVQFDFFPYSTVLRKLLVGMRETKLFKIVEPH